MSSTAQKHIPRNAEKMEKLSKRKMVQPANPNIEADSDVLKGFTKWKIITYVWVVFFPPYGLYRVWCPKSEFRYSEKLVWTMIIVVYTLSFIFNLVR